MVSKFQQQFRKEAERVLNEGAKAVVIPTVQEAYDTILAEDVSSSEDKYWSGYFHANQDINIDGKSNYALNPPNRPWTPNPQDSKDRYANLISQRRAQEFTELQQFDLKRSKLVKLGTAVDYGRDVGFSEGRGNEVYAKARDQGEQAAKGVVRKLKGGS